MITINNEVELTGLCLMDGKESTVRLVPSENKGITFYPGNSDQPVKATFENVISTQNCTVLGNISGHIKLIEHFMAACAFCGIEGLGVYVSTNEMPIFDGSSKVWVDEMQKAGLNNDVSKEPISIEQPISIFKDDSYVAVLPAEEMSITYCVNYDHKDYRNKWYSYSNNKPSNQIIEARTFGYLRDLEKFQKAGMSLGVTIDNTVGLTDEGGYTTALRSEDEPIKHKILDLIGDLYLTGINPLNMKATIIAMQAGHDLHVEAAKLIRFKT